MAKRRGRPPGKKTKKAPPKVRTRKTATKNGPRSQALPGMGQYMNERLNHFCESLYRTRQRMNKLRMDEKGDLQGAQSEMLRPGAGGKGKTCELYVYAGIRLRMKAGVPKISCELVDDEGIAKGPARRGRQAKIETLEAHDVEPGGEANGDDDGEDLSPGEAD
jgi:hypothetical protein